MQTCVVTAMSFIYVWLPRHQLGKVNKSQGWWWVRVAQQGLMEGPSHNLYAYDWLRHISLQEYATEAFSIDSAC